MSEKSNTVLTAHILSEGTLQGGEEKLHILIR